MTQKLVSIIVPVYNVEKYLEKCIQSIVSQTYKNIEIILIDDESQDESGNICDKYKKVDKRIKVIHKKNGGLSDARNKGLEVSKGTYIMFIDSDDYIDKDMVEVLYNACQRTHLDIACCAKYIEKNDGSYYLKNIIKNEKSFLPKEAIKSLLLNNKIDTSACDKLFKKKLFLNIRFPVGKYYEDLATIHKVIEKSNGIIHVSQAKYHYLQRDGSIINSNFNLKHLQYIEVSKYLVDYYSKDNEIKNYALANFYLSVATTIMDMKIKNADKKYYSEYIYIKKVIKENIISILTNKQIILQKKIMIIFIYFNFVKTAYKLKELKKINAIKNVRRK